MEEGMENYTTAPPVAEVIQDQVDKASGFLSKVTEYFKGLLPLIIIALILFVVGVILAKLISKIVSSAMKRSNVDKAARNFLVSVIRIVLYSIVVIMALSVLKVPMSSIITILGAVGLAVSLALQNCLTNICGGFIILFSKPFSAGDMVELDGSVGTVDSIGVLYTKMQTIDGKTIFIPNGNVTSARLINYTDTPARRVDLTFEISYNSDYNVARTLILTAVSEDEMILKEPAPIVRMSGHNKSAIGVDVLVWVKNENYGEVRYTLNESIKRIFDKNDIEIPFEQLDVHVIGENEEKN